MCTKISSDGQLFLTHSFFKVVFRGGHEDFLFVSKSQHVFWPSFESFLLIDSIVDSVTMAIITVDLIKKNI